jgi:hypothetical protein
MTAISASTRRELLQAAASLALTAMLAPPTSAAELAFTPERYGARGDGRTDDSDAFARLSDAVNAAGGGVVQLRKTTYLVGTQKPGPDGAPSEVRLMTFENCRRLVTIRGNGARLLCAPGQRYGMFQPDGTPVSKIVPKGIIGRARPYAAMIEARFCSGGVHIENIELDGNSGKHIIGGKRGDKGWQIGCAGVVLRNNSGPERLINVNAHHQPHDGFYIDGPREPTPGVERRFTGIVADMNGRQGMSLVGGHGYRIERSRFSRTGRGAVASAPGAGVDIEAQRKKPIRDVDFSNCRFEDNRGCAVVADSGNTADVRFADCKFVGTDNWAVWPEKPGFAFERCLFLGNLVHVYGDADPRRATRFTGCKFSDDPSLSPTGKLALRKSKASLIGGENVLFDGCAFTMIGDGILPRSDSAIYRNCRMKQASPKIATPRGTFEGRNVIDAKADLGWSVIAGPTIVNGKELPLRSREEAQKLKDAREKSISNKTAAIDGALRSSVEFSV